MTAFDLATDKIAVDIQRRKHASRAAEWQGRFEPDRMLRAAVGAARRQDVDRRIHYNAWWYYIDGANREGAGQGRHSRSATSPTT